MQTYRSLTMIGMIACAMAQGTHHAIAQPEAAPAVMAEAAQATASSAGARHLKLCEMLGLKVGRTYEFRLAANDGVHYWQVRSLGADGWILARDANSPGTWVNLSQVIAVTPLPAPKQAERPMKPNRAR
jgi:hypothetical protein